MSLNCGGRSLVGRTVLALVPVLVLVVSTSAPAVAASREAKERTARKACLKGDFETGVDLLADLFVDTKEPTYIFNQGRCFEQNRRYGDAVGRFEEYLRLGEGRLSAADKASAEKHIADCKEKLPPEPVMQPPPQPILLPTQVAEATSPQPPPTAVVTAQPAPKRLPGGRRWGLLTAGIVTSAVGVGGVVTGVLLNLKANQMASDVEKPGGYSAGAERDQESYKTLSMVGYGVGAACVVVGAIMIGFGARTRATSSPGVAFVPAVGAHHVGALLSGAF